MSNLATLCAAMKYSAQTLWSPATMHASACQGFSCAKGAHWAISRAAVPVTWGTATEVPVIVVYCELPM